MTLSYRKALDQIEPYIPGTSIDEVKKSLGLDHIIKLASNENPYGCPVSIDELSKAVKNTAYYPDPLNHPLYTNLANHHKISSQQLILGNGSDNILEMLAQSFINPGDEVISSKHSFSVYKHVTQIMNGTYKEVAMQNYQINLNNIVKELTDKTKIIFIANPNNPTGTAHTAQALEAFIARIPERVLVIIDQAYIEFSEPDYHLDIPKILKTYENVMVTQTFSKAYGLAGFRMGYGMASDKIITLCHKVRAPFNVNQLALYAADSALKKTAFLEKTVSSNKREKEYLSSELSQYGMNVLPSQANFLCCFSEKPAIQLYQALLKKGIIIRSLESFGLPHAIRVSIGKNTDNKQFLDQYKSL